MRARAVYVRAVPDAGKLRVTYSQEWQEYCARVTAPDGATVGEYFTDDRADAVATGDAMLRQLAQLSGTY